MQREGIRAHDEVARGHLDPLCSVPEGGGLRAPDEQVLDSRRPPVASMFVRSAEDLPGTTAPVISSGQASIVQRAMDFDNPEGDGFFDYCDEPPSVNDEEFPGLLENSSPPFGFPQDLDSPGLGGPGTGEGGKGGGKGSGQGRAPLPPFGFDPNRPATWKLHFATVKRWFQRWDLFHKPDQSRGHDRRVRDTNGELLKLL